MFVRLVLKLTQTKNVDFLLRLRILRYRQTPVLLKRVKAYAIGVSILAFTLAAFFNFGEFQNTSLKADASIYVVSVFSLLCYHTLSFILGYTLFVNVSRAVTKS